MATRLEIMERRKERLEKRVKHLRARKQEADGRLKLLERKAETRKLILLGRWLEGQMNRVQIVPRHAANA